MDLGLNDKIAMVTGAAGGIGSAIARGLCEEGCKTIFVDIDTDGLKRATRGYKPSATEEVCDITNRKKVEDLFKRIITKFGTLHILVNCAAVNSAEYIEEIQDETLQKIFDVNIKGYIYPTIYAIPLMKKAGYGRLIYINSNSGLKASAGLPLYSGSKYFNRGFAISTALELGKYGITSNSICPSDVYPEGEIEAKSWKNESLLKISFEKEGVRSLKELIKKRNSKNPMKRSCTVEDIKNAVLFLASERAGFINGQSIGVNGGTIPY